MWDEIRVKELREIFIPTDQDTLKLWIRWYDVQTVEELRWCLRDSFMKEEEE